MGGGARLRIAYSNQKKVLKKVLTCLVICTKYEQNYTVNCQSLLFCAKKYGPEWMDGWVDGKAGLRITYSNQ